MSDDDPQGRLQRLRQQVEAQVGAGLEGLSRIPSLVAQNFNANHSGGQPSHGHSSGPPAGIESPDFAAWQAQESESIEARLHQCRGERLEDHFYAWDLFLRRSKYSPLVLDQQLPKRPRPAELEDGMDPDLFSWRDAFEDLLAASSGLPMASTADQYQHRALWSRFPQGEPADLWLARLRAQRLTEVYFPFREWDYRSPQTIEEWVQSRKEDDEKRAAQEKETLQRVKEIAQSLGLDIKEPSEPRDLTTAAGKRDSDGAEQEPRTEQDLFDFIKSTSNQVLPPLTAFLKIFTNGKWVTESSTSTSRTMTTGEDVDEASLKTTKSTEEWVKGGYVHIKTEIRKTAPDGREVARETHYSVRPAESEEQATGKDQDAGEQSENTKVWTRGDDGREKKNSWLWK